MSILQFTPYDLFRDDSDSGSESDFEDEDVRERENERRQLSVLKQHDIAAYESWVYMTTQYTNLSQQFALSELHINNLTQQNELLIEYNTELSDVNESLRNLFNVQQEENTRLVDEALKQEHRAETFLGELANIQEQLTNGVSPDTLVYNIQIVLTQEAIRKNGYV
jgi:hypothetical protein